MWLASLSRWRKTIDRGHIVEKPLLTGDWTEEQITDGIGKLHDVLGQVGDQTRERGFRMNLTLCLHRAVSDEELARLDQRVCATHLAGGPIEVLFESRPGGLSTQPCSRPERKYLSERVWLPVDCGRCPSCRARLGIEEGLRA